MDDQHAPRAQGSAQLVSACVDTNGCVLAPVRRWCFALLFLFAPQVTRALDPATAPGDYILSSWDFEAGLPHDTVRYILQSSDGYLWVGTQRGLARFDGLRFTIFDRTNTPEFVADRITGIVETPDRDLWIGTANGLLRYRAGRFTLFGRDQGLTITAINAMCVDPDGTLVVGGREGIARRVDERFVYDVNLGRSDLLGINALYVDRTHTTWVAIGTEVFSSLNGKVQRYGRSEGLPNARVLQLVPDWQGTLLAVTQNGLYLHGKSGFEPLPQNSAFASLRMSSVLFDQAGTMWAGSTAGLDRVTEGRVVRYRRPDGSEMGIVDHLCEDREGSLWLATSEGLYRLTDRRASSLTHANGLKGVLGISARQARDGSIWVSTWAGGVTRILGDDMTHYRAGAPLSRETVTAIYEDPDGSMWLGNRASSVDHLRDGKVTTYIYEPGLASNRPVTALFVDQDGTVLIGISRRGLLELRDGAIRPVPGTESLAAESVNKILRTRNGELILVTSIGLYHRRDDRTWGPLPIPGITKAVTARDMIEDADGTRWITTESDGLIRWRGASSRTFTIADGMLDNFLVTVLDDELGSIWISSPRGIARIRRAEFDAVASGAQARLNPLTVGRVDGTPSGATSGNGMPDATRLADGRLMFATHKGFAIIDPQNIPLNIQPPSVVVESLRADGQPLQVSPEPLVAARTSRIEIRYTALSLVAPGRIRFRYKLEGSDSEWIEAGTERIAYYTHLRPGRYTFRVTACNNDGVWNETGATLTFRMEAQFYQTLWFRVFSVAGVAGLIATGFGLRMRQMKRREDALAKTNAELDQRVSERTAELSRSNQELAHRESLFRLIFEHAPVGVSWHRTDQGARYHYNAAFRRILDLEAETLPDNSQISRLTHPDDAPRHLEMERKIRAGEIDDYTLEQRFIRADGRVVWGLLAAAVVRDSSGRVIQVIGLLEDITARKQAEEELVKTHKRLLDASRMAGMAEVASGVLHDVGNVLNSANVSATMIVEGLRRSKAPGISKVSELLSQHADDLAAFLTSDPRGKRLPHYLSALAEHLRSEHASLLEETRTLRSKVEHISEIVARQQGFAQLSGLFERLPPAELIEDSLRMNELSLGRHGVDVQREFDRVPDVLAERHKVLQILINLIKNAKQAVDGNGVGDKHIRIRLYRADEATVGIDVIDNGVGIPPENISRVFEHGFTTRANGHGFGLHASANAAREMKGSLALRSDGPGKGAVFTLTIPVAPKNTSEASQSPN